MKKAVVRPAKIGCVPALREIVPAASSTNRTMVLALIILGACLSDGVAQAPRSVLRSSQVSRVVVPVTQPVRVEEDISVDLSGLGGAVYSTGLEDVWVRLFSQKLYSGDGLHSGDGDVPYFSWIYLFATNRQTWLTNTEICLGSNHEDEDKFIKLSRLPAGEIRIRVQNTVEGNIVETGTASRNPDGLRHATVRKIPDGVVEVRFEHSPGLTEARLMSGTHLERLRAHNHFFHDCILQFGGGVTLDPTVFTLLTMSKDTDPEKRKVAKTALKQIHPNIARSAGIP